MMKRVLGAASVFVLGLALIQPCAVNAASAAPAAVPACASGDPVVWLNTSTKKYHTAGDRYYGTTKHGRYLCKSAADAGGAEMAKSTKTGAATPVAPAPTSVPNAMTCGTKHHRKHRTTGAASPMPSATTTP